MENLNAIELKTFGIIPVTLFYVILFLKKAQLIIGDILND
jgi:hypothetical protein